jgi:DNA polymerase III subunit epsilon
VITRVTAAEPAAGRSRPLDEIDFVIVDVETTGWTPGEARITEIGAVRISGGHLLGQFSSLVNPGGAIPERIAALTGISDAMVAAAPPLVEVLPAFLAFARGGVLTAHNAPFDVGFLMAACRACDLPWPDGPVVDTVELAHWVLGEGEVLNCKLSTLAAFFGARTTPRHRALADALATADVLMGLLPRLSAAGVGTLAGMLAVQDLARRQSRPRPWLVRAVRGVIRAVSGGSPRRGVRYRRWLGIGARGGRRGHRDRPGESRRGAHPGNGGGDSPDPAGQ